MRSKSLVAKRVSGGSLRHIRWGTLGSGRYQDPWVIQEQGITHLIPETGDIREIFGKEGGIHKFLFMGDEEA